jgi:hypothetical protein
MNRLKWITMSSAVLLGFCVLATRADEPKPAITGRASIASCNEIKKLLTDLAIPLPLDIKGMIEMQYPVIGAGGIRDDKPIGAFFVSGEKIGKKDNKVAALPVAEGKAAIADLAQGGGNVIDGHPDTVLRDGQHLRRSANYLFTYAGSPDILAAIKDDALASDYAIPGRLAVLALDLDALRVAAPKEYQTIFTDSPVSGKQEPAALVASRKAVGEMLKPVVDKLGHISVVLRRDDRAIHIEGWMGPVDITGSRKFLRPTFPADVVIQTHTVYPNTESANWGVRAFEKMPDDCLADEHTSAAQSKKLKPFMGKLFGRLIGSDAQSIALTFHKGKPVAYFVNQYSGDIDVASEVQGLVPQLNAAGKENGQGEIVSLSTYPGTSGKTLSRLILIDQGVPKAYVDFVQSGHTVTLTIAHDDGKYLDAVAELPTNGEISNLCTGNLDLSAALKAAQDSGQAPPLPPEQLKEMAATFAGQSITWVAKANAQTKDVSVDLAIPFASLKEIGKLAGMAFQRHATPPVQEGPGPESQEGPPSQQ